jgi:small multidrug resistance family-3 protein
MGADGPLDRGLGPSIRFALLAMAVRSIALFVVAAAAEIAGAYMMWIGLREGKGAGMVIAGAVALAFYGLAVAQQPSQAFGRILAAYGGVFVLGSLLWGIVFDGFRPDRFDLTGAVICLLGVGTIMYAPR